MSSFFAIANPNAARRLFLGRSALVLSGAAVALLAGCDVLAAKSKGAAAGDVRILNTALGAELEAIAAYQVGAESGLLQKPVLALAVRFQKHHKEHADLLASTVQKLGGKPVSAKSKYGFPVEGLKTQADVLRFAVEQTLNRFLADPPKTVPGTTMTYAGVADPKERADLIAYLQKATATSPECRT